MRTLIQGGWVVGFENGQHTLLKEGVVVVEGDRVLYIGPRFDGQVDRTIEARHTLISPGFINIHAIANLDVQTLVLDTGEKGLASSRAYAVDGQGELEFNAQRLQVSARFSLVQLLKGGSTTIVEITTMAPSRFEVSRAEAPILAETAGELGVRLYTSHKFRAGKRYLDTDGIWKYHWDEAAARSALRYAIEIVKKYEGAYNDRVRTMLFPYQFDAFTPELLQEVKQAARDLAVPLHMHTSQSLFEFHECLQRYSKTPVQLLDSLNFLDPQTILTHLIYTTLHPASGFPRDDTSDLRIVAERGATVAHCAVVYARRNRILNSFARYRELGINVPIGTDTFPQDMIEEMRWTAFGCKWQERRADSGTAWEVFNAATLDGAKALGRDDLGRLAPGAKADLVLVNFEGLHIGPVDDPIKTLVYAAHSGDIETVMVDGKVVMEGSQVMGVDEAKLIRQAVEAHLWQKERFAAQNPEGKPASVLFPTTYPVI